MKMKQQQEQKKRIEGGEKTPWTIVGGQLKKGKQKFYI